MSSNLNNSGDTFGNDDQFANLSGGRQQQGGLSDQSQWDPNSNTSGQGNWDNNSGTLPFPLSFSKQFPTDVPTGGGTGLNRSSDTSGGGFNRQSGDQGFQSDDYSSGTRGSSGFDDSQTGAGIGGNDQSRFGITGSGAGYDQDDNAYGGGQQQRGAGTGGGKASMTDKLKGSLLRLIPPLCRAHASVCAGTAEKMTGKMTGDSNLAQRGQERKVCVEFVAVVYSCADSCK